MRTVDLEAVRFEGARKIEPADGALVLAVSDTGQPLMWKSEAGGKSAVVVNLDPALGDFFLSPWFPAIVHAAALHLAERGNDLAAVYPTGSRIAAKGVVADPAGTTEKDGARIENAGFYRVDQSGAVAVFGGAVLHRSETLLDGKGPVANAGEVAAGHPPALWLILLGVAVLVGESMMYHRRKAG